MIIFLGCLGYLFVGFVLSALAYRVDFTHDACMVALVVFFWPVILMVSLVIVFMAKPLDRLWHWIAGE